MRWPPDKSFTRRKSLLGQHYFVAINYGGKGIARWVNLVSVLDGNVRLAVSWNELNDNNIWSSGWNQFFTDKDNPYQVKQSKSDKNIEGIKNICLHPSQDSGLLLPIRTDSIRPWDSKDNI